MLLDTTILKPTASIFNTNFLSSEVSSHMKMEYMRQYSATASNCRVDPTETSVSNFSSLSQENDMNESVATGSLQDLSTLTDTLWPSSTNLNGDQKSSSYSVPNFCISPDDHVDKVYDSTLDEPEEKEKRKALMEMFPSLKAFDIIHALQKYNGNIESAVDELMTQTFLEETGDRYRSIDGFASSGLSSHRKKRKKKKERNELSSQILLLTQSPAVEDSSDAGSRKIEFLMERVQLPVSEISKLLHESGGSLAQTISRAIQRQYEIGSSVQNVDTSHANALKLHKSFPSLSVAQLESLCQITNQNLNHVHDLIEVLTSASKFKIKNSRPPVSRTIPLNISSTDFSSPTIKSKPTPLPSNSLSEHQIVAKNISSLLDSRNEALSKASAAYRRANSDHLMSAVSSYYAEEARNCSVRIMNAQSNAADLLVASQTSKSHVDLHGLDVKNAVRIVREKVTTWWHELNEIRIQHLKCEYRIITGAGTHSKEGYSKIKSAVAKMLVREGWKIEVGTSEILVTGIAHLK